MRMGLGAADEAIRVLGGELPLNFCNPEVLSTIGGALFRRARFQPCVWLFGRSSFKRQNHWRLLLPPASILRCHARQRRLAFRQRTLPPQGRREKSPQEAPLAKQIRRSSGPAFLPCRREQRVHAHASKPVSDENVQHKCHRRAATRRRPLPRSPGSRPRVPVLEMAAIWGKRQKRERKNDGYRRDECCARFRSRHAEKIDPHP